MMEVHKEGGLPLQAFLDGIRRDYRAMNWASKIFSAYGQKQVEIRNSDPAQSDTTLVPCYDIEVQQHLYRHVFCDEVTEKFPPAVEYKRRFLKHFINSIESSGAEVCESMLKLYLDILDAKQEDDDFCFKSFEMGDLGVGSFKVSQAFNVLGMATWDAGFFLAEFIMTYPDKFQGQTCLELGAGLGLTGLTLCRVAPRQVVLTDYAEPVLRNLQQNLENNHVKVTPFAGIPPAAGPNVDGPIVNVAQLDWMQFTADSLGLYAPDVILAADVVYDPELVDALVNTLKLLLFYETEARPQKPVAYVCNVCRNAKTFAYFFKKLAEANITSQDITESVQPQLLTVFSYEKANLHLFMLQATTTPQQDPPPHPQHQNENT